MKGYKVFNEDWTCIEKKYEVGKTYEHEGELIICRSGLHFCERLVDCYSYYEFNPNNHVCEVEAVGDIVELSNDSKRCTNKLIIVRELEWGEVLNLCNSGDGNSGYGNSGNYNSGYRNSGNYNSGDGNSGYRNSGFHNSGDGNSGYRNSGDRNSGDHNSGIYNSGYRNSGNYNSGDWNNTNYSAGVFCTIEPKILMFDSPTDMTLRDWKETEASRLLLRMRLHEWICSDEMTADEKEKHPEHKTTGGYLRKHEYKDACRIMWDDFTERERAVIKAIPNFDADKFEAITGITLKANEPKKEMRDETND